MNHYHHHYKAAFGGCARAASAGCAARGPCALPLPGFSAAGTYALIIAAASAASGTRAASAIARACDGTRLVAAALATARRRICGHNTSTSTNATANSNKSSSNTNATGYTDTLVWWECAPIAAWTCSSSSYCLLSAAGAAVGTTSTGAVVAAAAVALGLLCLGRVPSLPPLTSSRLAVPYSCSWYCCCWSCVNWGRGVRAVVLSGMAGACALVLFECQSGELVVLILWQQCGCSCTGRSCNL